MQQKHVTRLFLALGLWSFAAPVYASNCKTITAPSLTLVVADCAQAKVWEKLQASGQFPDVFASPGKTTLLCYASSAPASAQIGQHQVTITSTLSGWTTDFVPGLFGGPDNLGTVVTQLTIVDGSGNYTGKLFTRDTIDLSQISPDNPTASATEEDVIVGGTNNFGGAKGTYRVESTPNDPYATSVSLTDLQGVVCSSNW